jgi:hypothetical protein
MSALVKGNEAFPSKASKYSIFAAEDKVVSIINPFDHFC